MPAVSASRSPSTWALSTCGAPSARQTRALWSAARHTLARGLLVTLLVSCGNDKSGLTASASPTPGSGGAAGDGSAAEYAYPECTACAIYQYCNGSALVEQLNQDTYCEATVVECEHGCVDLNGWAGCAIQCGGKVCPVSLLMALDERPQCCTADGQCGVAGHSANEPACTPVEPTDAGAATDAGADTDAGD